MSFRDRLDVGELLRVLGVKAELRGNVWRARCPNPDHADSHPSWSMVDMPGSLRHGGHRCLSCHFGGGPWELVQAVRGLDEVEAQEFVTALILRRPRRFEGIPQVVVRLSHERSDYRLPSGVQIPSLDGSEWHDSFATYLSRRQVTDEQIERWHIGFATRGPLKWRVVIPVHTRGRLVAYAARSIFNGREQRYDMPREQEGACPTGAVFGEPLIDSSARNTLTIAEGVFSALALERAGAPNPVALLGSDWSPTKAAVLTSGRDDGAPWERVIIATDPDRAGDRVARWISASFRQSKISRLRLDRSPDDLESDVLQDAIAAVLAV